MSLAVLPGSAEAPEGLMRNSDRGRPTAPLAEPQGETAGSPRPQRVLHAYGSVLGVCRERRDWIDDNDLVRPARSDPRRRREDEALRAQVPVAASLEGFCFRPPAIVRNSVTALSLRARVGANGRPQSRSEALTGTMGARRPWTAPDDLCVVDALEVERGEDRAGAG
jgi:hypothetical protein